MGTPAFQEYIEKNEANFYKAYEEHEKASALRKQKRAKKRSRPVVNVDESDEDVPLIQQWQMNRKSPKEAPSHSQETYTSLFVDSQDSNPLSPPPAPEQLGVSLFIEQRPESRRAPLEQSTDDGETSSLDEPVNSWTGELAGMTKTNPESRANKSLNLDNSILSAKSPKKKGMPTPAKAVLKQSVPRTPVQEQLSKPSRTLEAPIRTMTPKSVGLQQDSRRLSTSATQFPSTKSTKDSNLVRQKTSVTNIAVPSSRTSTNPSTSFTTRKLSGSTTSTAIRRSGTASKTPIKMTNEPKAPLRKGWQNGDKHYNKMKYRHRADLKSRSEGAPDLNALSFVGTEPPGLFRHKASDLVDNPYGRREVGNRRIQEPDVDEHPRRESVDEVAPLHNWEADKVPLVCPYWRLSSNCSYGPQKCRFMHRHKDENGYDYEVGNMNGYIPPKYRKPPLTCPYWLMNKVGCKKSDAECDFAHTNTGWIPPDGKHKTEPIHIDPNALPISDQTLRSSSNSRIGRPLKKRSLKPSDMTCWYWTEGKCHNAPKDCAFQHFDTGCVADPPPSVLTCRFWLEGTCLFTADDCKFQHNNTGIVSGQPSANPSALTLSVMLSSTNTLAEFTTVLPREDLQQNQAVPTPTVQQKRVLDVNMHDGGLQLSRPWESPPVLLEQSQFSPVPLSPSVQTNGPPIPPLQPVKLPATSLCLRLNENIEQALKINFLDLFEWGRDEKGKIMLDRRVLLLYHPVDHAEDLEVITRWLLMHHVEVSSPWFQGCWDYYQQQLDNGGSGIVIVSQRLSFTAIQTVNISRHILI
jgi:chromo domain-containing protein 1